MTDLVIVSMHERGFPQADIYEGCGDMDPNEFSCLGRSPDGFFTMSKGDTLDAAKEKARRKWPGANVVEAAEEDDEGSDGQSGNK